MMRIDPYRLQPAVPILIAVAAAGSSGNRAMRSEDGVNWTLSATPDLSWQGVCYSAQLKLFVAVAVDNVAQPVMTSPDGITWTQRTAPATGWLSVAWSPTLGIFAAVGPSTTGLQTMTSPDGITWTQRSTPLDALWDALVWVPWLGLFVAGNTTAVVNKIMTSPDGIIWTERTTPNDGVYGLAATATRIASVNRGNNSLIYSDDGISWTLENNDLGHGLQDIASDGSQFVAVSVFGEATSPTAVTWTARTGAVANDWEGVCWSGQLGLFIATSDDGTGDRVMTSPDGITWTSRSTPDAADGGAWLSIVASA